MAAPINWVKHRCKFAVNNGTLNFNGLFGSKLHKSKSIYPLGNVRAIHEGEWKFRKEIQRPLLIRPQNTRKIWPN